jgi:predicted lipase
MKVKLVPKSDFYYDSFNGIRAVRTNEAVYSAFTTNTPIAYVRIDSNTIYAFAPVVNVKSVVLMTTDGHLVPAEVKTYVNDGETVIIIKFKKLVVDMPVIVKINDVNVGVLFV